MHAFLAVGVIISVIVEMRMMYCLSLTGAAIIVIMVIAVIIGLLIFVGGLIYLKR